MKLPRYPIYVPSRGRAATPHTIRFLLRDGVPFRVVVEQEEADAYAELVGHERLLILPESGRGLIFARNWIKAHSIEEGHERHWQLDDNIRELWLLYRGIRVRSVAGPILAAAEDFTDRYENIAISGLNYKMFVYPGIPKLPPFHLNCRVYSATLVNNAIPHGWRLTYNDDTDICLQVLADGWCTVLFNAFLQEKLRTMTVAGGNTDELYRPVDGRLRMARSLERVWPHVVHTYRRYGRPQHRISNHWRKFDTPLRRRTDIDWSALPSIDDYGLQLTASPDLAAPRLRAMVAEDEAGPPSSAEPAGPHADPDATAGQISEEAAPSRRRPRARSSAKRST